MASRKTQCPECNSNNVEVTKSHNADNPEATLRCRDCKYRWEGELASSKHERGREKGWER